MGRRKDRARTPALWIATNELPQTGDHPFYHRLNQVLDEHGFDDFVEAQCAPFSLLPCNAAVVSICPDALPAIP